MNIVFTSQHIFKNQINSQEADPEVLKKSICISIITEPSDTFALNKNFKSSIQMSFKDDDQSFTDLHADQILYFIDQYKNRVNTIFIHCLMGVSRSAAIALFLEEYLNNNFIEDTSRSNYSLYNRHIYSTLHKCIQKEFYTYA